jgi:Cu-Zn family superoxide dismutase
MIKYAICVLPKFGYVYFEQKKNNTTQVVCRLQNVSKGKHGLHVHKYGDISEGCSSTCKHYNPTNADHGDRVGTNRHRGDLGNIDVNKNGICNQIFSCTVNVHEIIGRSLVLHAGEDDLGMGGDEESKKTGNSGKRIDCGVIGICKKKTVDR